MTQAQSVLVDTDYIVNIRVLVYLGFGVHLDINT